MAADMEKLRLARIPDKLSPQWARCVIAVDIIQRVASEESEEE